MVKIKELVEKLDVNGDAPIYYFDYNEIEEGNIAYCRHITKEELSDYYNNIWNEEKEYDNTKLGVYLPNMTVGEFYNMEYKHNPINIEQVITMISNRCFVELKHTPLIYTTFGVLHEIGHWIYFKNSKMKCLEFAKEDSKNRRIVEKSFDKIRKMPDNCIEKYVLGDYINEAYRNIPSEKAADEFALNNIKRKLEILNIKTEL